MTAADALATPEQAAVLESTARLRIVRAVPGSGKTWLVGEIIKRALAEEAASRATGIAALSFTRVAGDEIRRAVGRGLAPPHFVGTLDAFVYKFVVRPFARIVRPEYALPRLIPGEWSPEHWEGSVGNLTHVKLPKRTVPLKLLGLAFVGVDGGVPRFRHRTPYGVAEEFSGDEARLILKAKQQLWSKVGWMSHSDVAFVAAYLLAGSKIRQRIVGEVVRRFPRIILDEAQDTGWFLGVCAAALCSAPAARAVIVGDPDQAIFEFNGARPDLFHSFQKLPSAAVHSLSTTMRCRERVATAAKALARGHQSIQPAPGPGKGAAFLLSYEDLRADVAALMERLLEIAAPADRVRLVARGGNTVDELSSGRRTRIDSLGSKPLGHMFRAVDALRRGRQPAALAEARAALGQWLVKRPDISDEGLRARGVNPIDFRMVAAACLLEACRTVESETLAEWGARMQAKMRETPSAITERLVDSEKLPILRPISCDEKDRPRADFQYAPPADDLGVRVRAQTVHSVKGETHDVTVLVCPPPAKANSCPSVAWWSDDAADQEERRIAFVAASRPRRGLVICVSVETLANLTSRRPGFVELFSCDSISAFLAATPSPLEALCDPSDDQ